MSGNDATEAIYDHLLAELKTVSQATAATRLMMFTAVMNLFVHSLDACLSMEPEHARQQYRDAAMEIALTRAGSLGASH